MLRITDLHAHPTLKTYYLPYLRANLHALVYNGRHWNPFAFQTQYRELSRSGMKVMLCAHYVIEQGFLKEGINRFPGQALFWTIGPYWFWRLRNRDPWRVVNEQMDQLEQLVPNTNRWVRKGGPKLKLVRRFAEIGQLADNEIGLVHAIEGAHVLGYGPRKGETLADFWAQTRTRLDELERRGVAMITLAHFWDNMFVPQTDGTEWVPKVKHGRVVAGRDDLLFHMKRATFKFGDPQHLGEQLVRDLLERGIAIDLSHTQEHARDAIYGLCEEYRRPVILSHVGLKHFYPHEYNLSDDEVKRIHRLGGVVGLILSKRLLVDPVKLHRDDGNGIPTLVENMLYLAELTGDVSCIALGSDFDGLTHPFRDCCAAGEMPQIAEAMRGYFNEEEIDAILYGNALRALERGWGRRPGDSRPSEPPAKPKRQRGKK